MRNNVLKIEAVFGMNEGQSLFWKFVDLMIFNIASVQGMKCLELSNKEYKKW